MRLEEFIDFCARMQLDACEPTSYYFPDEISNAYLMDIKGLAFRLGLDISGTAIGNDFCVPPGPKRDAEIADAKAWIDHAAALGAPVIRIFAGKVPPGDTEEAALARCIEGIDTCLEHAAEKGVVLALENHGGITATPEQMLRIVHGVKASPWFGVNFDSGNFRTADPYGDLAKISPFATNAQIKVSMHPGDKRERADFKRILGILRDADYRGYIVLEYEESEDPLTAIPPLLDELRALL
jgi:sugar phosphate isomerase/epimerase